ncbi:MAG: hypothetical protein ACI85K_001270 [Hyphomicrobiaceae bacterium]|jgi:hypothetical protein
MGVEMPMLAVAMTRMPGGDPHLAALGALVYPLSLLIEAPIIMLLAASTALVRNLDIHEQLRRFAHVTAAILTVIHMLVAFTPAFDFIALDMIGVPDAIIEPGRLGMQIMTPWTWAIAYRRFQQGVLIRCEQSKLVVYGTMIRLLANVLVLAIGLSVGTWSGIVVGTIGIICGVTAEAIWAGWCFHRFAKPKLREQQLARQQLDPGHVEAPLQWPKFAAFYIPLAFTPLITIVIQPIGSWAMSKMSDPLMSLAAWPAVYGLVFLTRTAGYAFNEVVVALAGKPGGHRSLRRCGYGIAAVATMVMLLLAATPLGEWWFGTVTGLSPELTALASASLLFAVLMPGYAVAQNYHQGLLVHNHRTRPITEAVVLYLVICSICLVIGVEYLQDVQGIQVALGSFTIAGLMQTTWLLLRRRGMPQQEITAG